MNAKIMLKEIPGYRELIKGRVSECQKRRREMDYRRLKRELGSALHDIIGESVAEWKGYENDS